MKILLYLSVFLLPLHGFAQHKAYLLSEKHLSHEAKKGHIQKKGFSELPPAVKDTIEGTFEWYDLYIKEHPNDYLTSYSNMISLDTAFKFGDFHANESYEKAITSPSYKAGQFFDIAGRKFEIPPESQITLKIIYDGKLFLMGAPLSEDKKFVEIGNRVIIATDNANHAYWIVPLK